MQFSKLDKQLYKNTTKLLNNHNKILLAISTGVDSMILLNHIMKVTSKKDIEFGVAHVNHNQREESKQEELFIENFCKENNIPYHSMTLPKMDNFTEEIGRKYRYDFFFKLMNENQYTALLTGHHKNDQAETVMMRFIKGLRLYDLSGIKEISTNNGHTIIRPLLTIKKKELYEEAESLNIKFFEDSSNKTNDYFRNRIRNIYLPDLETENPNLVNALSDLSNEIELAKDALSYLLKDNYSSLHIFRSKPQSVQYFIIQNYLKTNLPSAKFSKEIVANIITLLNKEGNNSQHKLTKNYTLYKENGFWSIRK